MMRRAFRRAPRGYSLIEIAGVMAVLGILLGAALLPLNRQARESEYRQERAQMDRLREAVLGYALRHKTAGVEVALEVGATRRRGDYPAGRPYLPCPDVDGDGVEDRGELQIDRAPIRVRGTGRRRADAALIHSGACIADKGVLPWRTLGTPAADRWGSRYTYFADPIFAHLETGFDEKTLADASDRRLPYISTPAGDEPQDRERIRIEDLGGVGGYRFAAGRRSVICFARNVAFSSVAAADLNCVSPFVAGEQTDGLPFVIVSHGKNGAGAFNHRLSRHRFNNNNGALACRSFQGASVHETVNAHYTVETGAPAGYCDADESAANADGSAATQLRRELQRHEEGYFFAASDDSAPARAASSISDNVGMDDLLTWMTRADLARRMSETLVFPLVVNDDDRPPILSVPAAP